MVDRMDAQVTRLQLIAPIGQDSMGVHWRAVDALRGREVRAHELTGAYVHWRPALSPGYELVLDGGRVFIIAPVASGSSAPPASWSPPATPASVRPAKGPRTGLVVGVVLAAVLAVVVLVGGIVVLLHAAVGGARTASPPPSPVVVTEPRTDPVNVALVNASTDDCLDLDWSNTPSEPDEEFSAYIVKCETEAGPFRVITVHKGVPHADVAAIAKSQFVYCGAGNTEPVWLIWASADGGVGTMLCVNQW